MWKRLAHCWGIKGMPPFSEKKFLPQRPSLKLFWEYKDVSGSFKLI